MRFLAWVGLADFAVQVADAQSPEIVTQPTNEVVVAGGTATFSVAVSGTGPFTYQWQFNGTNLPNSVITTVAGNGTAGYSGDGGAATEAELRFPTSVAVDASDNVFIADYKNNSIRKVGSSGIISTLAGNGTAGYSGDGGPAVQCELNLPVGVAVDASGNVFIADTDNQRIRVVGTNGIIATVAGDGTAGYSGDGGAATNAQLYEPAGVAVGAAGSLFIAQPLNNLVREVGTNGIIATVAGNGTQGDSGDGGAATNAQLNYPLGLAVDESGNLFIAEYSDNSIAKVGTNGVIVTVEGGEIQNEIQLSYPTGVAVDASGNLFIADSEHQQICEVGINGIVSTVAGNWTRGYSGDGGPAVSAQLNGPRGVAVDAAGNLFIADWGNQRIREVVFAGPTFELTKVTGGNAGSYDVVVSSPYGKVTSSVVTLQVLLPPTIGTQPESQRVTVGNAATLSVVAAGTAPLEYQWYFDGARIEGQTDPSLLLSDAALTNAGSYTVVVTNLYGAVTSAAAVLSVGEAPGITEQPVSQTNLFSNTASFSVAVSGTGPFTYQWQLNGTNLPNNITTVAGNGTLGYSGDGGPATMAELGGLRPRRWGGSNPIGVAVDAPGNLFIADAGNNVVRKVGTDGIINTVAGNGTNGYYGDGGAATKANLSYPVGVAVDTSGNVFIADADNNVVRAVGTNGIITTVAGGGTNGLGSGAATNASLYPSGVAVDGSGNLFIADSGNSAVRKVDANGAIATLAGNGTNGYSGDGGQATRAELSSPSGVAVDGSGNLFIADSGNNVIRKLDTNGFITTVAGSGTNGYSGDGGAATNASLSYPSAVVVDGFGNILIADENNDVVRRVDVNGIITTVAGNGSGGYSGDGGAATNASLNNPTGVAVDTDGSLLIADADNYRIREVVFPGPALVLQNVGRASAGTYDVVVSSPYGSVTSAAATLTVLGPPFIITQPVDVAAVAGSAAALSVDAGGTAPLGYFWYFNGTNPVPSGTNSTLSLAAVSLADAGGYTVVITNLYGSATSFVATLSVGYPPSITGGPASQAVWAGGDVTLTVAVAGGGPYGFQWQQNGVRLANNLITTVAGGWVGDGGAATHAGLFDPTGLAVDPSGNLFIADYENNRVRKVDTNGIITTVAGNGLSGYSGDGGGATNANLDYPIDVAVDAFGNLFIADYGNNRIRKVGTNGIISTVAGNGNYGYSGDHGAATSAELNSPSGIAVEASSGNLFIADSNNERIRKVGTNGIISTVAGNGTYGYAGDGGAATSAELGTPTGVAVGASGVLFIADWANQRIRKVGTNGIISTVAGNGTYGYAGDGGVATNASLSNPSGVVVDGSGNLFIANENSAVIRKVDVNGMITTVAGNGSGGFSGDGGAASNASLNYPHDVAVDASGNLFIADSANNRIRKVDLDGIITTVAGNGLGDGGEATEARLDNPSGVAVDGSGNLFIADEENSVIREVDVNGIMTTLAGNGAYGYSGDGEAGTSARLNSPAGVAADGSGNLFIADSGNNVIRKVDLSGIITTVAGNYSLGGNYSGDGGVATSAGLWNPLGVAVGGSGNLYIADSGNNVVRRVDVNGIITTLAGNGSGGYSGDGGAATNANLDYPAGVALSGSGDVFIADEYNSVIRKVDFNGIIATVAGNGSGGYSGDGGAATNASLFNPSGVAVGAYGNLFVADSGNNRIREVHFGGVPTLTLDDVSAASGGGYQVVISSPYGSITSALATLTVVWPSLNATLEAGPAVRISLTGAPGASYVLQTAESLAPPINWQAVSTNTADRNGNWSFTDTNLFIHPARFYLLQEP